MRLLFIMSLLYNNCFYYKIKDPIIKGSTIEIEFINRTSSTYWIYPDNYLFTDFQVTKNGQSISGIINPLTGSKNEPLSNEIQVFCENLDDEYIEKIMNEYSISRVESCLFLFFKKKFVEIKSHEKKSLNLEFFRNSLYPCYKFPETLTSTYTIESSKNILFKFPEKYRDSLKKKNIIIYEEEINSGQIPLDVDKFFNKKNDMLCQ